VGVGQQSPLDERESNSHEQISGPHEVQAGQ
jgi:hypothetical protein